jgi:FKBP-type peptidyl-prolyl cis-trans isomerase SlyD
VENKYDRIAIAKNCVVALRYIMKDSRGDILENTMDRDPVNYLHGSPAILPLLQAQIEGLMAGDKKTVRLTTESGLTNEDFTFDVIIDDVRVALNEEIILGYPVKLTLEKCGNECACYSDQDN